MNQASHEPSWLPLLRAFSVRGKRVFPDSDLAAAFGVPTKRLNELSLHIVRTVGMADSWGHLKK